MAKNKKSLLNEATVRRMMKLADIPELSENFFSEAGTKDDRKVGGPYTHERDDTQGAEDELDYEDPTSAAGKERRKAAGLKEDEDEEEEIDAMGDELGAEDDIADEEGAELDAEASGGDAEITPEAAQAIVDLAAQLEASGALEGGEEEVEAEVEMSDVDGEEEEVEVEDEEEFEGLEEALAKLGIEVIDDKKLNEAVRKRVLARLRKEKRAQANEVKANKIANRIFARLQKK